MIVVILFLILLALFFWWLERHRPPMPAIRISFQTPAPGAWSGLLRAQLPLLVGIHLLIFTAILFGTRSPANIAYAVGLLGPTSLTASIYSEWAIDSWIGPSVVCVAFVAIVILLTASISTNWRYWRGDIVLAAGLLVAVVTGAFFLSQANDRLLITTAAPHLVVTPHEIQQISVAPGVTMMREWQSGWILNLASVVLLIAGGLLIINLPTEETSRRRLSRMALWGLPALVLSPVGLPIVTSIFGFIAVAQITRSKGKLYGLRLAAVEALLLPWLLIFAVTWGITAALVIGVANLFFRRELESIGSPSSDAIAIMPRVSVGLGPALAIGLIALLPALVITFFVGRKLWRSVIGRPVRAEIAA